MKLSRSEELLDRIPPHSIEAERGVLGSMILDPRRCDDVADLLMASSFYAPQHGQLFRSLLELRDERKPVDAVTLLTRLRENGELEAVGGSAYLADLMGAVPHAANAVHYAEIVASYAKRRRLIQAAESLLQAAWDMDSTVDEIIGRHEQQLVAFVDRGQESIETAPEVALAVSDRIDAICERNQHIGLPTGFSTFDDQFGGLFGGELTILAARPGVGKSSLVCQMVDYLAQSGRWVYMVSLEMSSIELALRTICGNVSVNGRDIRTGRINVADRAAIVEGINRYGQSKLWLDTRSEITVETVLRTARRLLRSGLSAIVVDYLQLLSSSDRMAKRYEQVGQQSRAFKMMARELGVPVIVLCQLNRQAAEESEPQLHHLRESGSIEQDADVVLFIHRPAGEGEEGGIRIRDNTAASKSKKTIRAAWPAELIVAKNRNGQTGRLKLDWEPQYTRFSCWGDVEKERH
jgi:replicative DNA helicase